MNEIDFFKKALNKVTKKLNSRSLNYVASVEIYPIRSEGNVEQIIKSVFGSEAIVGGTVVSDKDELFKELMFGLSYAGDTGAYASLKYVGSAEHERDLNNIKNKLKPLLANCSKVTSFWLKEGHPFYPVFWDFAFLIDGNEKFILIGSSSD